MQERKRNIYEFGWYLFLMAFASGISLLRGFFVAGLLDPASFGRYATIVATGMFFSSILSFGETERTIKIFPRLWVEGRFSEVLKSTNHSVNKLYARVSIIAYLMFGCLLFKLYPVEAKEGLLVVLVSLNVAIASIYASAIRSTGKASILAKNTAIRSFIVLSFAGVGATFFSWYGAIFGEALGFQLGSCLTRLSLIKQVKFYSDDNLKSKIEPLTLPTTEGKYWLFFAALCVSVPAFLDRAFVSLIYDKIILGTLGFLMLFVSGASTLTGIIIQKAGPQLVKIQHKGDKISDQIKYGAKWLFAIWSVLICALTIGFLALKFGPAKVFFDKFHLDSNLLFATSALCLLQINVIADYIIISRNSEQSLFIAALSYVSAVSVGALLVWYTKPPLADFIWMLVCCKVIYLFIQASIIIKLWFYESKSWSYVK